MRRRLRSPTPWKVALLAALAGVGCSAEAAPDAALGGGAGVTALPAAGAGQGGGAPGGSGAGGLAYPGGAAGVGDAMNQAGTAGDAGGAGGSGGAGGNVGTPTGVPIDPALRDKCSGSKPIVCAFDAPNGNYDVTIELGADAAPGSSLAEAETRHAFATEQTTAAGEHRLLSMTVNVRAEVHDGGQSAPGNVLDLTITGDTPALRGVGFRAAPSSLTIFVAGDSTVCDWLGSNTSAINPDETGWAQALAQYFEPGVAIANYADSGETAGGFYGKFFPPAKAAMKAGDYLFIQFGHNDQKDQGNIDAYKNNVMKYVKDARDRQVTPVLFTPVSRKGGADFAGIDGQARQLASDEAIALVDLSALSLAYYATVPDKNVLFADGGTHLSSLGANAVARLVATDIKTGTLPLKAFVK